MRKNKSALMPIICSLLLLALCTAGFGTAYAAYRYLPLGLLSVFCALPLVLNFVLLISGIEGKAREKSAEESANGTAEKPTPTGKNKLFTLFGRIGRFFARFARRLSAFWFKTRGITALVLCALTLAVLQPVFFISLGRLTSLARVDYFILFAVAAAFVLFIVFEKWCKHADADDTARVKLLRNLRMFFSICRTVALLTAVAAALKLLGLYDAQRLLMYVDVVIWSYVSVFVLFSLIVRAVKRELTANPRLSVPLPFVRSQEDDLDLLSYLEKNTGITLRSLWSIKFIRKTIPYTLVITLCLFWLSTGIVTVNSNQQGVVYRFGTLERERVLDPGLHFTLPWPFDKVELFDTDSIRSMTIGYNSSTNTDNVWTEAHGTDEYKLLMGSGDELVSINLRIEYNIDDVYTYANVSASPEKILQGIAYELVTEQTIQTDLSSFMTADRTVFSESFRLRLNERLEAKPIGIEIKNVVLESIHPPVDVAENYQELISAEIDAEKIIIQAQATAIERLAKAESQKIMLINSSDADYYSATSQATASVAEFMASVRAYGADAEAYTYYKYLNALRTAYGSSKLVILGQGIDPSSVYLGFNPGIVLE